MYLALTWDALKIHIYIAMEKKHMLFRFQRGYQIFHNHINNHNYGKVTLREVLLQSSQGAGGE